MHLKDFINAMPPDKRADFAGRVGSTLGHLQNVMYGIRPCATDLAVAIERESRRAVTRPDLRSDWRAHWPELAQRLDRKRKPAVRSPAEREAADK